MSCRGGRGRKRHAAMNRIFAGEQITVRMGDSWYSDTGKLLAKLLSGFCDIQHVARPEAINVFSLSLNLGGG